MCAVEAQELAVAERGDGGVALALRDQRLLAEGIATFQLRQQDLRPADEPLDVEAARFHDVVAITFVALADHRLAGPGLDPGASPRPRTRRRRRARRQAPPDL